MNDLTLVVLAAGMGSRYGGLKQTDPVGPSGEFLVDYSVHDAIAAGFNKVVFVIRKDLDEQFRATIGARTAARVETAYAYQQIPPERRKPWGTGEAVLVCSDVVDAPFAVINADDFYGAHSYRVLADFLADDSQGEANYCMVGFVLENTLSDHGSVSRGLCSIGDAGQLVDIEERTDLTRASLQDTGAGVVASMNMWGFRPSVFPQLQAQFAAFAGETPDPAVDEFLITAEIGSMIVGGSATVDVLRSPDAWFGMTNPDDRPMVVAEIEQLVDEGVYPGDLGR
jgi:UTP-glucose-1-phosphate uridylyltransferase